MQRVAIYSLLLVSFSLQAGGSYFGQDNTVGTGADNLMVPTAIITELVLITCYLVGSIFLFASVAQYKMHKENPKLVPLSTPIMLIFLGILCLLIPYTSQMGGDHSALSRLKRENDKGSLQANLIPNTTRVEGLPSR